MLSVAKILRTENKGSKKIAVIIPHRTAVAQQNYYYYYYYCCYV